MPLFETLEFSSTEYRATARAASIPWLRQEELRVGQKTFSSSFGVGAGIGAGLVTGGVAFAFAAYKAASVAVADQKSDIIQDELRRRGVAVHEFRSRDFVKPLGISLAGSMMGMEVGNLVEASTSLEKMEEMAKLPDGASQSTGLLENPAEAARGAAGAGRELLDAGLGMGEGGGDGQGVVGTGGGGVPTDAATTTALAAVSDPRAYHAGMVQVQTVLGEMGNEGTQALLLYLAPPEPDPECQRSHGADELSCDSCEEGIEQGVYWRKYLPVSFIPPHSFVQCFVC